VDTNNRRGEPVQVGWGLAGSGIASPAALIAGSRLLSCLGTVPFAFSLPKGQRETCSPTLFPPPGTQYPVRLSRARITMLARGTCEVLHTQFEGDFGNFPNCQCPALDLLSDPTLLSGDSSKEIINLAVALFNREAKFTTKCFPHYHQASSPPCSSHMSHMAWVPPSMLASSPLQSW
jgi:hypothetical protein